MQEIALKIRKRCELELKESWPAFEKRWREPGIWEKRGLLIETRAASERIAGRKGSFRLIIR
jgi:hypothetical protein